MLGKDCFQAGYPKYSTLVGRSAIPSPSGGSTEAFGLEASPFIFNWLSMRQSFAAGIRSKRAW